MGDVVMRGWMTILVALTSFVAHGQQLEILLKGRDAAAINRYVAADSGRNVNWILRREILPGYEERSLRVYSEYRYARIDFLSINNELFYYKAGRDSFTNECLYDQFKNEYFKTYGTELKESDLFKEIVYGSMCGFGSGATPYREKLDSLLKRKDIPTIRDWLRCANVERQVYAIQGLMRLELDGIKIGSDDAKIIELIKKKQGDMRTCAGCIYGADPIGKVINEMEELKRRFIKMKLSATATAEYW